MTHTCKHCHEEFETLRPRGRTCPACHARRQTARRLRMRDELPDFVGSCGSPESTVDEKRERLANRGEELVRRARCYARRCCPLCGHTLSEDTRDPQWLKCQRAECGHLASPEALRGAGMYLPALAPLAPAVRVCAKCGAPRTHTHVPKAAAGLGLCRECARPYRQARAASNLPLRPCGLCGQPTRAKGGFCRVCSGLRFEAVEKSA